MTTKTTTGLATRKHDPHFVARLGAAADDCCELLAKDPVCLPASIYNILELDLPLPETVARDVFAPTMSQFAAQPGGANRSTNQLTTNASAQPFVLKCYSIYASVEMAGWTANGEALSPIPAAAIPTPGFDGVVAAGGQPQLLQAWLEWGIPTWEAIHELAQTYNLQVPLGNVMIVLDEKVANVGILCQTHDTFGGASDSLRAIPEYVRRVNDRQRLLGAAAEPQAIFLPATTQQITGGPTPTFAGVPTPMVGQTLGAPIVKGLFNGCYPTKGIMYRAGQPIFADLVRPDGSNGHYEALITAITNNPGVTYDVNLTGVISGSTSGFAQFAKFIGGKLDFGVVLKGCNITPRCLLEWYAMCAYGYGMAYMTSDWKDAIDAQPCCQMLGLDEGESISRLKRSDLLARLARLRAPQKGAEASRSYTVMSYLAGAPGIDDKDNEATRVVMKQAT